MTTTNPDVINLISDDEEPYPSRPAASIDLTSPSLPTTTSRSAPPSSTPPPPFTTVMPSMFDSDDDDAPSAPPRNTSHTPPSANSSHMSDDDDDDSDIDAPMFANLVPVKQPSRPSPALPSAPPSNPTLAPISIPTSTPSNAVTPLPVSPITSQTPLPSMRPVSTALAALQAMPSSIASTGTPHAGVQLPVPVQFTQPTPDDAMSSQPLPTPSIPSQSTTSLSPPPGALAALQNLLAGRRPSSSTFNPDGLIMDEYLPPRPSSSLSPSATAQLTEIESHLKSQSQTTPSSSTAGPSSTPTPSPIVKSEAKITATVAENLFKLNQQCADASEEHDTPMELTVNLLPHQRQALAWMIRRERETTSLVNPRGGILADDQGFGKTLSVISLMLTNRPQRPINDVGSSSDDDSVKVPWGNLVIAPTSILRQWAAELISKIAPAYRPRVLVYHGNQKKKLQPSDLVKFDVVITSYGVLLNEYPKVEEFHDKRKQIVKKRRDPGPLYRVKWYRVILDEAQAIKNRRCATHAATCDLRAERRWCLSGTPIQNTIDDLYSLFLFLRYQVVESYKDWEIRFKKPLENDRNEVRRKRVFDRFQVLLGGILLRRAKNDRINGRPVISLPRRSVRMLELQFSQSELDYYRRQETQVVRRMNELGEELFQARGFAKALLVLLRLRQACNHPRLCAWDCETDFKFSDNELDKVENRMKSKCLFNQLPKEVQDRLYRELAPGKQTPQTCPICMEPITSDGIVTTCGHIFCADDLSNWRNGHDSCPSCRKVLNGDEDTILLVEVQKEIHAIIRKKQREEGILPDNMKTEVTVSKGEPTMNAVALSLSGKRPKIEDSIEASTSGAPAKRRRGENGLGIASSARDNDMDDEFLEFDDDDKKEEEQEQEEAKFETSTKIRTFLEEFKKILETSEDKVLCFSQWTRMLDLVEQALNVHGYEYVRLDGSMTIDEREEAIEMFKSRSKCRLFLISLKAGSTGLNLTCANRVFLLDSWWNPAVEDQAIDRVHRIGQTKDVEVIKMKISDTIENRIMQLQERKRNIADGALGVEGLKTMGRRRLTRRDVVGLFTDVYTNVRQRAENDHDSNMMNMVNNVMNAANLFGSMAPDMSNN